MAEVSRGFVEVVGYLTGRTDVLDIPDSIPVFGALGPIRRFVRLALGRAP